jgi:hypothetical protein
VPAAGLIQIKDTATRAHYVRRMNATETLPRLIVERLSRKDGRTVYPLMREVVPSLSMLRWLTYARRLPRGPGPGRTGILIARRLGYPHPSGAVCYRRDRDITHGSVLTAEHFIALDLLYPEAILSALLSELDSIAVSLGCAAIRSIVHGGRPGLVAELCLAGHKAEGVTLTKYVVPARSG